MFAEGMFSIEWVWKLGMKRERREKNKIKMKGIVLKYILLFFSLGSDFIKWLMDGD